MSYFKGVGMKIRKIAALSLVACAFIFANADENILGQIEIDETHLNDPIEERKNSSTTKIVVTKEEIARFKDQSMGDILKRLPGLTFTGPAGYVEDIRFRGADKGYTQILIDGEPIADGKKDRQFQVSRLSADMIERIEIIRQTTAEFDSDGVAGTINIILKNPPKKAQGNYSLVYGGSHGEPIKDASINYGDKQGKLSYSLGINALERPLVKNKDKIETEYNDNPANTVKKIKTEDELEIRKNTEVSIIPKLKYEVSDSDLLTLSGYFINGTEDKIKTKYGENDEGGVIGVFGDHNNDKRVNTKETEVKDRINNRIMAKYETIVSPNEKYGLTYMVNKGGEEKTKETYTNTTVVPTNITTSALATEYEKITELENKLKADGSFVVFDSNFIKVGAEYAIKDFDSEKETNGVLTTSPSDQLEIEEKAWKAYIMDEYSINSSHVITPGIRIEEYSQESIFANDSNKGKYNFSSPSLHYLWHITSDINLRASVAEKVKRPKFDELYTGIKDGDGSSGDPYVTGNQDLKAEKSLGYELGLEKFFANNTGLVAVNGYYREIEDKIQSETILRNDGNYYTTSVNIGEAKLYGVEFDTKKDLSSFIEGFNVYGNLTFMRGTWMDDNVERDLKDVPKYSLNIGFDQQIPKFGLTVGAGFNRLDGFEAYESATKEKIETSRNILDVYALKNLYKNLDLRISAKNITEVEKSKQDTEFYDSGRVKKVNNETEYSEIMYFVALEGKF